MEAGIMNLCCMKTEIISIGNELLIGDTINTNASWLGQFMTELGFEVTQVHTISDDPALIKETIRSCMTRADVTLCTGGLGPTHDDMTKKAVAELFKVGMKRNEEVLDFIRSRFEQWKIPFSRSNAEQADVPENAEVLFNNMGSAPGMWFHEHGNHLVVMPGVPKEMQFIMEKRVLPLLKEYYPGAGYLYARYIKTVGIGESTLNDEVLGDLSEYYKDGVSMAFLPFVGGVTLRLNGKGTTAEEAKQSVVQLADAIYERASDHIIGEGKQLTHSETLGQELKKQGLTIATAESCTGGMIANELTNVSGSSAYVKGGIVAYSNTVKMNELGVSTRVLTRVGAVSKEVALQMAKGVAQKLDADIGISTTGVAGPTGGTKEKPVGTVWFGYWSKKSHFAVLANLTKDRMINKERSARIAMEIVRRTLKEIENMPYNLEKQYP